MPSNSAINKLIAGLPGVRRSVIGKAEEIAATARGLARGHGSLPGCISVEYPNPFDADAVMTHKAALSIETGHDDEVFHSGWVPGLHIMRDAAAGHH
ncbi:MAG: DUF5403 family protein [Propionibacteriaceae bacterium]|jgi:hypothetical protein|nr:DUF5403 family protein [Propionibacteriaceae bacterium]